MKWLVIKTTAAVFTFSIALSLGAVSHAQTIFQDFEGGTVMPATTFFTHPGGVSGNGGAVSALDSLGDEGIPGLSGFAGALGGGQGDTIASLGLSATGGVGGSQAALLTLTNSTSTVFAFGGVSQVIGRFAWRAHSALSTMVLHLTSSVQDHTKQSAASSALILLLTPMDCSTSRIPTQQLSLQLGLAAPFRSV